MNEEKQILKSKKLKLPQEVVYILALLIMPVGVALMQKADLGFSMIAAPVYLLSQFIGISFGTAEYCVQFILVSVICILVRKLHFPYYLSFVTAVIYGFVLDLFIFLLKADVPATSFPIKLLLTLAGILCTAIGVALFFHTYLPAGAYDMFVKILAPYYHCDFGKFKMGYDIVSLGVSFLFTFLFFQKIVGIGLGTVICAAVNGALISWISKLMDKYMSFPSLFPKAEKWMNR